MTTTFGNVCSAETARRRRVIEVGIESNDEESNCLKRGTLLDIPMMFEKHTTRFILVALLASYLELLCVALQSKQFKHVFKAAEERSLHAIRDM
jgi:hypothetical protein